MKPPGRYYRASVAMTNAWALGVIALLLALAVAGAFPLGERLVMFLP
jgi:hypothetical protein